MCRRTVIADGFATSSFFSVYVSPTLEQLVGQKIPVAGATAGSFLKITITELLDFTAANQPTKTRKMQPLPVSRLLRSPLLHPVVPSSVGCCCCLMVVE